jgi:hypothetical protein
VAQDARLAGDRGHGRRGGRHVRDLERLSRADAISRAESHKKK